LFTGEPDLPPPEPGRSPDPAPARRERLGGRVVTADGRPVPDVTVVFVRRAKDGETLRVTGRADDHGRFELEVPPDGSWHVQVTGTLPGGVPVLRKSGGTIRSGRADRDLTVEAADEFTGRVLDPDGTTVPGATIEIWSSKRRGHRPHFKLTADTDGSFRVLLPAGGTARIKAYVETTDDVGLPYVRAYRSGVKAGEPVEMRMLHGAEIRGRITWREGGPAAGLPLRAHQALGSHKMVVRARTDGQGNFRIGGLYASMDYRLEIDKDRYEGKPLDLLGTTRAKAGSINVSMEVSTAVLVTGTLYKPTGEPAGRWSFWFVHDESGKKITCRTRKDGTFVLNTSKAGTYTAWTNYYERRKRHRLRCGTFRSGDSGVVLQIPRP
ncbi:MAG: carboxypeptidase regulatory-like domain-containing protein, partial [Planctomycetota bacterium]